MQRKGEEAALLYAGAEIREKSQQAAQEEEQISKAAPWWCVPRVVCSSVCQRRRGGVVDFGRARLPSYAMVVGLVVPAVSFLCGDDAGRNQSLLGTASMAPLASCPS